MDNIIKESERPEVNEIAILIKSLSPEQMHGVYNFIQGLRFAEIAKEEKHITV
jgi:hypothetical protein